ncbi:MAG TPA: OmpH family outer membrane protein [Gemmatimonadales bacterium]|nr:OmpH family outer membrane protein [Gemmatimonadales bacterium]
MKLAVVGVWVSLIALSLAGPELLVAQQGSSKVAYVNTQAILKQTPGYVKAESTFTKELEGYRVEVQKLQATLDSAASDFDQQSVMLSPTQRAAKRKDLQAQQQKLEQRTQELQQRAATRERELLDPIQSKVNSVIEGIRAAGNYAIIFDVSAPNNGIVTADKGIDLTSRVIQQLKAGS